VENIGSIDFFSALFIIVPAIGAILFGTCAECNFYAAFYRYRTTGVDKKCLRNAIIFSVVTVVLIFLALVIKTTKL